MALVVNQSKWREGMNGFFKEIAKGCFGKLSMIPKAYSELWIMLIFSQEYVWKILEAKMYMLF